MTSRRSSVDPSTSALLDLLGQQSAQRSLPHADRRKKIKERQKMAARLSGRATYDLDPQLKQRITSLAKSYSIPASQLAQVLLLGGLALVENGALDIPSLRKLSRSPRYDFVLDLENLEISR